MNGMNYDDWQAFLERRDSGAGWQWPLNLAVALHLAIFASAAVLQNLAGSGPGLRLDNTVSVNFVSLAASGLPLAVAPAAEVAPLPALNTAEPLPAPVEIKARTLKKTVLKAVEPKKAKPQPLVKEEEQPVAKEVEKTVAKEAVKVEKKPEQPIVQEAVEIKPEQSVKKIVEKVPEPKAAEVVPPKPEPAPVVQAKKDVVSLNPVKKAAQEKEAAEKARIAEAKKQNELARIAEVKKQEEAVKAAQIEAEKKAAAAEAKRVAEEQARKEKAARIAEAKKERERIAAEAKQTARIEAEKKAAAAEARRKIAAMEQRKALAEAQRVEHDAQAARQAAAAAKEQLVRALRQNVAVSSAVSGSRGSGSLLGGGIGTGGSVGVGGTMALKQYAGLLNEKISSRWKVPEMVNADRKLKTVVALIVSKTGTIEDMKIEQKSGDALFDQSVLKALRSAEPLPNFPALLREPKLEFALNFTPQGLTL